MLTTNEEKLIEIKFAIDMYNSMVDTPENTLEKIEEILNQKLRFDPDQQYLLEWLEQAGQLTQPFLTIWRAIERGGLFPSTGISVKKQFEVMLVFAKRGLNKQK